MSGTKRMDTADRDIPAALRADIDKTRTEMSGTIRQIEERLSPAHLKEQVLEQFHDAKEKVKHEVREELLGAKQMVRNEIAEAKHAVRDATIGRVEHMVDSAKNTLSDGGNTLVDSIRANPVPALLAGVGLAWLFMSARNKSRESVRVPRMSRGYGDPMYTSRRDNVVGQAMHRAGDAAGSAARYVRDAAGNFVDQAGNVFNDAGEKIGTLAHQAGDAVSHLAHDAGDKVTHLAHDARDAAGHLAHDARDAAGHLAHDAQERAAHFAHLTRDQAMRLEGRAEDTYRENPLAVGAAAFALGTVVGLSLPHTQREDEWMGETRDRLLDKASHLAGDAVGAAKERAQGLVDEMSGAGAGNGKSVQPGTSKSSHA